MAEKANESNAAKKHKPAEIKQEPVDSDNGYEIILPELQIKDEHPDWQMEGCFTEEPFSGLNSEPSAAGTSPQVCNHTIADSNGSIQYDHLKKDLKQFIETTVEEVVERCFQKHFAKLVALIGSSNKSSVLEVEPDYVINSNDTESENELDVANQALKPDYLEVMREITPSPLPSEEPYELRDNEDPAHHLKIANEFEAEAWNEKLNDKEYFNKYVRHFENLIVPNSYAEMGDQAGFFVAQQLFAPGFWDRLTWAGYKKANNTKASFCRFQNVIRLLFRLISVGDPMYSKQKLEWFIRRRMLVRKRVRVRN